MARGRAVVRGRAGARLLLRLALIVACSKGRSSTAPAATRLRPAAREAALDWSAYADPQTASQRFRVRKHEPSAAFSLRSSCITFIVLQDGVGGRVEWRVEVTELERRRVRQPAPPCCLCPAARPSL